MLDSINNNTTSQITNFRNGVDPYGASVYIQKNNTLQRSPQTDTVAVGNKQPKKLSTGAKVGIGIGATAVAVLGAVMGHKAISANQMNKAIKAIDTKFSALEGDLPKVQNTFKDVFMRDDLTLEQTKQMLNEYKQLAYKRVDKKVSMEDYAKSLFETATKNYGLDHAGIQLDTTKMSKDCSGVGGFFHEPSCSVHLYNVHSKEMLFSVIHHELRHAKQSQAVSECISLEDQLKVIAKSSYEHMSNKKEDFDTYMRKLLTPDFKEGIVGKTRKQLARKGITPAKQEIEYAKKMNVASSMMGDIKSNHKSYWINVKEQDARYAETAMNELFSLNKEQSSYYKQMDEKFLSQKAA